MRPVSHSYNKGAWKRQRKLFHLIYRYTSVKLIKISKEILEHGNADNSA